MSAASNKSGRARKNGSPSTNIVPTTAERSSPTDSRRDRGSRQQPPVSCHFCRVRKLRCNRGQPCSNCVSRGISCQSANASSGPPPEPAPEGNTVTTDTSPGPTGLRRQIASDFNVLQRLEKLEKLLAIQSERWSQLMTSHPELFKTDDLVVEDSHLPIRTHAYPTPSSSASLPPQRAHSLNEFSNDVVRLEQISVGTNFPVCTPTAILINCLIAYSSTRTK